MLDISLAVSLVPWKVDMMVDMMVELKVGRLAELTADMKAASTGFQMAGLLVEK